MEKEIWRIVNGFENYEVSNYGNVRHIDRKRKRKINDNGNGYSVVKVKVDGKGVNFYVHRAVAEAFVPNPFCLPEINHKDENRKNNAIDNLEWCTRKYNINYGTHALKVSKKISKAVNQYSTDGTYINTYKSATDAEKALKIPTALVNKAARSYNKNDECYHRTARGFIWCYVENEVNEPIKGYWKDKYNKNIA